MAAGTLLVVEDDRLVRQFVVDLLRDEGYAVVEASDGAEAVAILEAWPPRDICLILLDMGLPRVDGTGVLEHPADRGRTVPVVAMSAGYLTLERARRAGAAEVLAKPFDVERFLEVVARLCGGDDASRSGSEAP